MAQLPRVVLFDLDGTLSDSAPGILGCLRVAFADHDLAPLDPQTERALLGPPFYDTLPPLIGEAMVAPVIASYRERYGPGGGMYLTEAFDGAGRLVTALHEAGVILGLATSKPEVNAEPIMQKLGLAAYFTAICGDTLDGARRTKALVVGEALRRLGDPVPADVLMVGDRRHDVEGAAEYGVGCLGAGWGYGVPGELLAAGARAVYATPADLQAALLEAG